ncbi:MAG: rod shape-determining protein RodA [Deltaproteobacteria bacterium]|nr:rod shape-determining protein RodA [Deltaproteobacteria bacterium]
MQIDRRLVVSFDWPLFVLSVALALLGIVTIYSATCSANEECSRYLATKQSYWLVIGLCCMVVAFSVDYQRLNRWAYPIYGAVVLLLGLVLLIGITSGGSQRWLDLRFFAFQPSELAKLVLVLVLAKTLCYYEPGYSLTALGVPLMLCAPVLLLVLLQPDLGTAVLIFLIAMAVVVMSGLRVRSLVYFTVAAIAALPVGWQFLKPYQKTRIWTFMNPESDPLGAGYHVVQSKIAIGSGRLWGTGYLQGSQNRLEFLPEQHTDFIFAVFAEEWGFSGCVVLLAAYTLLILLALRVVRRAQDRFGVLLAAGIAAMLFWQFSINIGMVTGLLPVVGIPLPLISYGGSSMVTTMLALGLLVNVSMRRNTR